MSMDSRDFGEEIPLQTPLSSGSSSSSLLSSSSSSADSHVAAVSSINENKLKVSKFETNNGIGEGGSSDVGSENEGFLSGEEEFESAVDRPIVGYPDEDTLQGGDSGASFVGFEKGSSTPVSIRPIAKVSVDSDDDDDGDDDDGEEEVLGSSRVDVLEDGSVGKEGVGNEVAFPKIEGNEVDILEDKEEKEDKETFVSGEDENLGGDSDREEGTVELSGNSNEGKVPESSPVEDVGFVSEESPNAGKQVSDGVQLNDVVINQQHNEVLGGEQEAKLNEGSLNAGPNAGKQVSDGVQLNDVVINQQHNEVLGGEQEAKLNEGSLNAGKESDGVQLNDVIEKKQPNDVLSGGEEAEVDKGSLNASEKVSDEIQLNDVIEKQQSNEVSNEGQEVEINEGNLVAEKRADGGIELNDREAAKDEEQLKESETGVSVDDKAHEGDPASPKVLEVAGEFTSEDLDEKTLLVNSLGSGTTGVANREETKDLENGVTADSVNGTGAKVDNGFDNVRHEADKSVEHNYVVSNSGIDGNKLVINNEVATEEGFEGERAVITGIAEDEKFAATNAEDQQHDGLVPLAVNEETMSLLDPTDEAGIDNDSKDDSKSREITTGEVEAESSKEATSLVEETVPDNASVKDIRISDTPEIAEPIDNEEDGEEHHLVEEGDVEGSVTDGETEDVIFGSSEAAKQFLEELERGSGAGSHSGAESSHGLSQRIDGQIVTDSDDVDTDDEGDGKELFDSAALAALLKAARDTGSDGGPITVTSQDGSRLFSIERPAGLGSSLASVRNASRPSRLPSFTPSNPRIEDDSENKLSEEEKTKLQKLQQIRVNFLRLVQRLGVSLEDSLVAQVLYRFGLVAGRSSGQLFSFDNAKNTAIQLEAEGKEDFNFSLNILVLGKTGVGKSATINSIFGEEKTPINAFGPGTTTMKEIVGVVDGVKYRIFDSPGLKSSSSDRSINHKILSSIKNVMKKFPPDIVLYVDRLDNQTRDLNDLLLLRSISSSLDSSIWKNAIITLTHGACGPPDGPSGFPLGYEVFVAQRSHVLQQTVAQAVGDLRILNPTLMNPVSLVENNPSCRKNKDGQKVLPNGQNWRSQLLLLCYSIKILAEVGNLSKAPDSFDHRKLFGLRARSPPLPFLLSGLLQSRAHPKLSSDQGGENGDSDIDLGDLSDSDQEEEEDEYDQLPPFKPLRRSQIAKLSKEQRKAYFEEYDYRVKLLQKKQWKEELRRMREIKKKGQPSLDDFGYIGEDDQENGSPAAVQVPLPDMALPPSFDGDNPAFRYRFLEPTSQFLARPVLDTHGWDHDCGYDGVNLEHSLAIVNRFPAAVAVQITKDKKEFNIHLDSSVSAKHGENGSTMAGFDIQNIGRQLAYILRGETKFKNFRKNRTAAGISVTFLGENVCTGLKVEDQITIGKRVVLVGSTGTVRSQGDSAFGANLEMRLRESDFPIGQDQSSLGLSLVKWRGDMALGANFQSQFSLGRSYKMAVRAGLNNKLSGQISVRTSSSDQLQIALLAILPVARSIYNILRPGVAENYSAY